MADYFPPPSALKPGSTVWTYLRDSGGPNQMDSVPQQEAEVIDYCKKHNLVLVEVFADIAKSGKSTVSRDGLDRMMDLSNKAETRPDGLLLWNFARFSRALEDSTLYKALLRHRGLVIHSLTDPIPDDEFAGKIVEMFIDFSNQEKIRQNSRDVKRGLQALVKKGFSPGIPPRGYKAVKVEVGNNRDGEPKTLSKWEPDPDLWDLVILAWKMRSEGKSFRDIQNATGNRLYKSINCWPVFFRNKTYLGYGVCGELEVPNHHEAAITFETWEAVQKLIVFKQRKDNPNHPRRVGNPSLFSGFTYCMECGSMMTHSPGHKARPWRHYICGKKDRQGSKACGSRRISESQAENIVIQAVVSQVLSKEFLEACVKHARDQFADTSELEKKIENAKAIVADLGKAIQRTLNAVETTGSQAALDRLKQRENEIIHARAEVENLEEQLETTKIQVEESTIDLVLEHWRKQYEEARESNDIRLMKAWLMHFVAKIELRYNHAKIYYKYPMTDILSFEDNSRKKRLVRGGTH